MGGLLEDYMSQIPEEMQQFMDPTSGELTVEEWLEMEMFNGIIPLALPFFLIVIGARAVAGREERKMLDLLLSNPVPRWRVVAASLLTLAAALAAVLAITWVLTYIAVPFAGVDLSPARLAAGLLTLAPLCLFFGALALLLSTIVRRGRSPSPSLAWCWWPCTCSMPWGRSRAPWSHCGCWRCNTIWVHP